MRILVAVLPALAGASWPAFAANSPDVVPVVEVRLDPPVASSPFSEGFVASLESNREAIEEEKDDRLHQAYLRALDDGKKQVAAVIARTTSQFEGGRAPSFLQQPTIRIHVPTSAKNLSAISGVETVLRKMEADRSVNETRFLDKEAAEFNSIVDVIVTTLENSLIAHRRSTNFLQKGRKKQKKGSAGGKKKKGFPGEMPSERIDDHMPDQLNLRVAPISTYPTAATEAQAMEKRRDLSEELARQEILQLHLDLVEALTSDIWKSLNAAVKQITLGREDESKPTSHWKKIKSKMSAVFKSLT